MSTDAKIKPYDNAAGGRRLEVGQGGRRDSDSGACRAARQRDPVSSDKPDGFACVSCSWTKTADPHLFAFRENGAKATAWEITSTTNRISSLPRSHIGVKNGSGRCVRSG
jgi:hypothetical protein